MITLMTLMTTGAYSMARKRIWKCKERVQRKATEFCVVSLDIFGITNTVNSFGVRFRNFQYSLDTILFFVVTLCPAMYNS